MLLRFFEFAICLQLGSPFIYALFKNKSLSVIVEGAYLALESPS